MFWNFGKSFQKIIYSVCRQQFKKLDVKKNETDRSINTGAIPKLFARKRDETHQNKVMENRDLRFVVMREQEKGSYQIHNNKRKLKPKLKISIK